MLLTTTGFGHDNEYNYWVDDMFDGVPGNQLIPELNDAYGVAFRDINGDKLPDIYVTRFRELNRLLINRGEDTPFEDHTIQTGLGGNLASMGQRNLELGASIVDFNDDGNSDAIIAGWGTATQLFEANQYMQFTEITNVSGIELPISGNCAVWSDIDLDGDLDLFITDEHGPNHLYVQAEPGRFMDRALEFGVDAEQISQGATFGDLDGDGYPDLYVCNWFAPDLLYRNIEGIVFQRVKLPLPHLTEPLRSNGVWFGDIDNDADLDILVTDRQRTSRLYRNDNLPVNDGLAFTDITADFGLLNSYPAYSGLMVDFNNDGWRDIYFANIGPNQLFLNQRGKGFILVHQQSISTKSYLQHYSTGAAVADFDNDGDLDLFVSNKDTASAFYVNPLVAGRFLRIKVVGGQSNREGIGTKIRLFRQPEGGGAPTLESYQEISGGSGYLSIGERVVHFGVESQEKYRVEVAFPSGKEKFYNNLIPNQQIIVRENNVLLMLVYQTSNFLAMLLAQPEFLGNMLLFILLSGVLVLYIYIFLRRYRGTAQRTIWLTMAIILILFIGLVFIPEYGLRSVLWGQLVVLMVIIGTVTGFSERIRQLSEKRYGYRSILKQFSERLINIRNNEELYQQLTDVIFKSIPLEFCAIYEINKDQANQVCNVGRSPISSFTLSNELLKTLENNPTITNMNIVDNKTLYESISGCLLISVRYSTGLLALIVLGNRKDRISFKDDDSDVFTVLGSQAALAIENNRYIDETRVLAEQVSAARVREHYINELEEKNRSLEKLYRDLQDTQAQLIQSEKMSGLGQLVAGVAHELNNPIGYIYANMRELHNYIEDLKNPAIDQPGLVDSNEIEQLINESIEGSRRVKEIVENLRNFSRLDEAEFKLADIHEGLESTLMLLNNDLKNRITIHKNYGDFPPIYCLPGYLNQVFMNLLLNAVQAISGKGNIRIATELKSELVVISIKDDGAGIPADKLDHIFDPFYTSKPVGEGTGLGLSISYGIIERHNGTIVVTSKVGTGSEFVISLPITTEQ